MDKKDIDIIIECRAVIDKARAFNKARNESLVSSKSIDEAKAYIESKVGATTITADSGLKQKEALKEILEDERTKYTEATKKIMEKHGFINESGEGSVSKFSEWYEPLIFQLYKECVPIHGTCDFCGEKELIDQPCVKMYHKRELCLATQQDVNDNIYQNSLWMRRMGLISTEVKTRRGLCPKGHGFWADSSEYTEPPDGIDFAWRA